MSRFEPGMGEWRETFDGGVDEAGDDGAGAPGEEQALGAPEIMPVVAPVERSAGLADRVAGEGAVPGAVAVPMIAGAAQRSDEGRMLGPVLVPSRGCRLCPRLPRC